MPGDGRIEIGETEGVEKPVKKFTWKELSLLNSQHNAHVAYRGKVYNVSNFISRHPGGAEQILLGAGRDITPLFEAYHKEEVVLKVLEKFYIGELLDNEKPVFPKRTEFYKTVKKNVAEYFERENIDPKIDYWMFFRYATFVICTLFCQFLVTRFHESWVLGPLFSIMWGFSWAVTAMALTHDGSHFAVTHKPWVWKLMGSVHEFYLGASFLLWTYSHVFGHHPYVNIDGVDPDIDTFANDVPDIRRIKRDQKWLPRYIYQHMYVPLLYGFLAFKTRLTDIYQVLALDVCGMVRVNPLTLSQWTWFITGKASYVFTRWYIPYQYMPLSSVLLYNTIADFVGSYWLALIIELAHVITEVKWSKVPENNVFDTDWAEQQVASCQDFATDSWFWNVFTGALNHQTAHHLFPGVIQSHYSKITPIVKKTCEEFGIKYNCVDTTREALQCHINHLRILGQREKQD